jgi:hypothetical protein
MTEKTINPNELKFKMTIRTEKIDVDNIHLTGTDVATAPLAPESETKVKLPSHYLNPLFATDDTLKKIEGQLDFDFVRVEGMTKDISEAKGILGTTIQNKDFKGIELSYRENQVMKGIFTLIQQQNASESRPFVVVENISQLYEQILERKVTKKRKDGYTFKDFNGSEIEEVKKALDKLSETKHHIIIKGRDGFNEKTKKPTYFFYMKKDSLLSIEYLKRNISEAELNNITEGELKATGQIKIAVLPVFLRDYHKYFKLLPKDISKEVREACPEIKKVSEPIVNFIDFLHRQDHAEVRRNRVTLIKELKLEKLYKKNKKIALATLFKCYDVAKRTGYLADYKIDQPSATYEYVDVLILNTSQYSHTLHPKKIAGDADPEAVTDV